MQTAIHEFYDGNRPIRHRVIRNLFPQVILSIVVFLFSFASVATAIAQVSNKIPKCPGKNALSIDVIAEILNVHNQARLSVRSPALIWDCKLAEEAQEWASRGKFEHRTDADFGESIFVSRIAGVSAGTAVRKWITERSGWNNVKGVCQEGKVCSHYTQAVWKQTTRIGCGVNPKPSGGWKIMIVCNYDPPGNTPGPAY